MSIPLPKAGKGQIPYHAQYFSLLSFFSNGRLWELAKHLHISAFTPISAWDKQLRKISAPRDSFWTWDWRHEIKFISSRIPLASTALDQRLIWPTGTLRKETKHKRYFIKKEKGERESQGGHWILAQQDSAQPAPPSHHQAQCMLPVTFLLTDFLYCHCRLPLLIFRNFKAWKREHGKYNSEDCLQSLLFSWGGGKFSALFSKHRTP